jgi:hypothetical protein
MCHCIKHLGYKHPPSTCPFYRKCSAELAPMKSATSLDNEALFQRFVHDFPSLTALDLFCWKCAKPMALSYGRTSHQFYAEFFCHGVARRVCQTVDQVAAGERIDKEALLRNADFVRNSERRGSEGR